MKDDAASETRGGEDQGLAGSLEEERRKREGGKVDLRSRIRMRRATRGPDEMCTEGLTACTAPMVPG